MNPRVVKEADALVEYGHDVSVICTRRSAWATRTDVEFEDRKWKVVHSIPLGAYAATSTKVMRSLRRRLATSALRTGSRSQSITEAASAEPLRELVRAAKRTVADLYIAHYPAALPAAARAAKVHNASYAFDAEDFHLGDPPDLPQFDQARALTRRIEGAYLSRARYVSAASPEIATAYVHEYGIDRPVVVLNVFPKAHAPASPVQRVEGSSPSVYWFSQTIGEDRGLECAIAAIGRAASKPQLFLRGRPADGYVQHLTEHAERHAVADRIHWLPPAAPSSMEELASHYDAGLAAETGKTINHQLALANKIFTYLLAGVPVMLSDIPSHRSLAVELGDVARLYRVDDPDSLASAMDSLLLDSAEDAVRRRELAWHLGQSKYNWENEKTHFIRSVEAALAVKSHVDRATARSL